MAERSGGSET
jgi:hypothetical protein